ncbi:hypothetical protein COCOR_05146 [Corallococcus coralloides DSM 2259]|uniref:Lipoprotein n=1 Tax=Corallococcus coralloides (strain ATCC 25202 / DSM 2259 / NBRC 100086 / M2) TaxID=1144275 RepID=H8MSP9_CORCM|nr:keratin-associated protein 10-2 [Corallococcus coralloides]AFE06215.1 hypothetical protein COCOR_05146 [Corallococcus coralloides DSM 2259]
MISIRSIALSCFVVLGIFAACSDDSPNPPGGAPDASVPDASVPDASVEMCTDAGTTQCGDTCVSTDSDPAHCGGCGQACASIEACESGVCVSVCRIDGQQIAAGTLNAANACEQCTPATSATAWTQLAEGAECGVGQVCSAGACSPKCFINGTIYGEGTPNPANACEVCTPAMSTTAWSPREAIPLLVGGTDIVAQGWTTISQAPSTLTYGEDYVRLATSTNSGARTSGQLLLAKTNALDPTQPFKLRVTMQVESVNTHNQLDSGAAILGSFTSPSGNSTDRTQMIYLDSRAIGWADDTQSAAFAVTDGAYHVYELAVDASKVATVSVDGVAKLTRNNFTASGTIAIGDQTNDPNVDGVVRIKSVEKLCQ